VLYWDNDNKVAVKVTDLVTGNPILDATVTVSYYKNRSRAHPDSQPGEVLDNLSDLELSPDSVLGAGWYSTPIESTSVPNPGTYVRVSDIVTPGGANGHWEDLVTVGVRKNTDN
jgi:hypothetical protein